jgi:hypothetical protein
MMDATCFIFFSLSTDDPPNFNTCIDDDLRTRLTKNIVEEKRLKSQGQYDYIQPLRVVVVIIVDVPAVKRGENERLLWSVVTTIGYLKIEFFS